MFGQWKQWIQITSRLNISRLWVVPLSLLFVRRAWRERKARGKKMAAWNPIFFRATHDGVSKRGTTRKLKHFEMFGWSVFFVLVLASNFVFTWVIHTLYACVASEKQALENTETVSYLITKLWHNDIWHFGKTHVCPLHVPHVFPLKLQMFTDHCFVSWWIGFSHILLNSTIRITLF